MCALAATAREAAAREAAALESATREATALDATPVALVPVEVIDDAPDNVAHEASAFDATDGAEDAREAVALEAIAPDCTACESNDLDTLGAIARVSAARESVAFAHDATALDAHDGIEPDNAALDALDARRARETIALATINSRESHESLDSLDSLCTLDARGGATGISTTAATECNARNRDGTAAADAHTNADGPPSRRLRPRCGAPPRSSDAVAASTDRWWRAAVDASPAAIRMMSQPPVAHEVTDRVIRLERWTRVRDAVAVEKATNVVAMRFEPQRPGRQKRVRVPCRLETVNDECDEHEANAEAMKARMNYACPATAEPFTASTATTEGLAAAHGTVSVHVTDEVAHISEACKRLQRDGVDVRSVVLIGWTLSYRVRSTCAAGDWYAKSPEGAVYRSYKQLQARAHVTEHTI